MNDIEYITPDEAAEILKTSGQCIRLWIRNNKIPYVQVGARYRIDRKIIEDMLRPHDAKDSAK